MAGRTKENIPDTEAELLKETRAEFKARTSRGSLNKDPRFPGDKFAVIPRGSIDAGVTNLRKDGAYDIRIIHVPTDKSVTFPAALTSFSDGTAASFSSETYYGRMDPAPIYSNTTRTITVGFDVISYSEAEAKHNLRQMNLLQLKAGRQQAERDFRASMQAQNQAIMGGVGDLVGAGLQGFAAGGGFTKGGFSMDTFLGRTPGSAPKISVGNNINMDPNQLRNRPIVTTEQNNSNTIDVGDSGSSYSYGFEKDKRIINPYEN